MTTSTDAARDGSSALKDGHFDLSSSLGRAQGGITEFWGGDASIASQGALSPMIEASSKTSDILHTATQTLIAQGSHFVSTRDAVVPVSNDRPDDTDLA